MKAYQAAAKAVFVEALAYAQGLKVAAKSPEAAIDAAAKKYGIDDDWAANDAFVEFAEKKWADLRHCLDGTGKFASVV